MIQSQPLVSIGIPTYNRAALLKRSIESALNQDYKNIEIIVSDNASTDETERLCRDYCDKDMRIKYIRHSKNLGPTANFSETLKNASGEFFMWLGDDDWLDLTYVTSCSLQLIADPTMSLISGHPEYYRNNNKVENGKVFCLLHDAWWRRVISYYGQVVDNGMFYGLMRTSQIQPINILNTMGGDWHLIANILSVGKSKVIPDISVHRELGGATASYKKIADSLAISRIHASFPMTSIAISAWKDIVKNGLAYKARPIIVRILVGCAVFLVIITKPTLVYIYAAARRIKKYLSL